MSEEVSNEPAQMVEVSQSTESASSPPQPFFCFPTESAVVGLFVVACTELGTFFQPSAQDIEKLEEAKLKAKFPAVGGRQITGHSAFLQKRLAKGVSCLCHIVILCSIILTRFSCGRC